MRQIFFTLLLFSTTLTAQDGWKYIGPVEDEIHFMSIRGDLMFCVATSTPGLFRSTDAGQTWTLLPNLMSRTVIFPDSLQTVMGNIQPNKELLLSTDKGDSWQNVSTPPGLLLKRLYVKENVPGLVFAIGGFGPARQLERLFRSTDYGRMWNETYDFPKSTDGSRLAVGLSPTTPDIYVNADTDIGGQYLYHSPDDGVTWNYVTPGRFIDQIMVDPDDPQILYSSIIGGIHKSTDGGYSWNQIFAGISILQDKVNPNLLFTVGRPTGIQPGVIVSEDRGNSWIHDSTSAKLPFKQLSGSFDEISWLQYDPGRKRLYLQTTKGIYMRENFLTSISEEASPTTTRLEVYPQPASKTLTFAVELDEQKSSHLQLYNTLGQVVHEWKIDSSTQVLWNLVDKSGFPVSSGVYHLVFSDGDKILTQRFMIIR